jgi:hypothetical protein
VLLLLGVVGLEVVLAVRIVGVMDVGLAAAARDLAVAAVAVGIVRILDVGSGRGCLAFSWLEPGPPQRSAAGFLSGMVSGPVDSRMGGVLADVSLAALLGEIDVAVARLIGLQSGLLIPAAVRGAFDLGLLALEGALFGGMGGALDIGSSMSAPFKTDGREGVPSAQLGEGAKILAQDQP